MNSFTTSLEFQLSGHVSLRERGEEGPNGGWASTELVGAAFEGGNLSFGIEEGEDCLVVRFAAYHMPNEQGDRVFHASLEGHLSSDEVRALRRYLGFILGEDP